MSKICYINQPCGLGDILFCLKIAQEAKKQFDCEKIIWPVSHVYKDISLYIKSNDVEFTTDINKFPCNSYDIINNKKFIYIPLATSDQAIDKNILKKLNYPNYAHGYIKYLFCNICDWQNWDQSFEIKRNLEKEKKLFEELGLKDGEKYNFINKNFGTPPNFLSYQSIKSQNSNKNIEMFISDKYNIFDWLTVIENADEIHTVETSICYIIEKMKFNNKKFVYSRLKYNNQNFFDDYIYMKDYCKCNWNYM